MEPRLLSKFMHSQPGFSFLELFPPLCLWMKASENQFVKASVSFFYILCKKMTSCAVQIVEK